MSGRVQFRWEAYWIIGGRGVFSTHGATAVRHLYSGSWISAQSIKLCGFSGKNIRNTHQDLELLYLVLKAGFINGETDKLKIANFCSVKACEKMMKRQAMDWEKTFMNHTSNKTLVSRIYKECSIFNHGNNPKNGQKTRIDIALKRICKEMRI